MDLQMRDSKKLFKVFDASSRRRTKKREAADQSHCVLNDDECNNNVGRVASPKTSLQDSSVDIVDNENNDTATRDSSPTIPRDEHLSRRHRKLTRDGLSLALKAGIVSTPRTTSPPTGDDVEAGSPTNENDSLIYAFLEEAIKRDKRKQHRHGRRHEERRGASDERAHRHRHRERAEPARDPDRHRKEESPLRAVDQTALLETFAKLCAKINENSPTAIKNINTNDSSVQRTLSHKSLQCEVASRCDLNTDRRAEHLSYDHARRNNSPTRIRSQETCRHSHSRDKVDLGKYPPRYDPHPKVDYDKEKYIARIDYDEKYSSKIQVNQSRVVVNQMHEGERYCRYHPPDNVATRTYIGSYRDRPRDRDYKEFERRKYDDDRRRYIDQKTSRSFEVHRDGYDEERCRRTSRSDTKDKRYDDKYYEKVPDVTRHFPKDRTRRHVERFERNSVASRDEEYRERDRYSERERDSGLSVADGENSTISGRSHYMRAVKQEIAEQREAMDKMMKLWKELMRCFKGISQTQDKDKAVNESACENVRESAAAQLRLWRECMRRYETVARDVGDTDARLMEEINKQRSEMSEMATMWQECLQRYRDMSNDFNTLKQQLATAECPTRLPAAAAPSTLTPAVCAEGEGPLPAAHYRLPQHYPQVPGGSMAGYAGSPLRGRASAPPAWWWGGEHPAARHRSSRRSSPESRDGRDTDRRNTHRHKDSRDTRYKEKSSKPSAARSEHRRRKR